MAKDIIKVCEGPLSKSSKIAVESQSYISYFLIKRDDQGNICKPWVIPEGSTVKGKGKTMDPADYTGLKRHQRRILPKAQEKAQELALEEREGRQDKLL